MLVGAAKELIAAPTAIRSNGLAQTSLSMSAAFSLASSMVPTM
jgi:hypothetical protein